MDSHPSAAAPLDQLPVFPLSQAVLFPGVLLPLHIFEQRYQELVADALAGHRLLVVTMVRPDVRHHKRPPLAPVGCLGRIVHAESLAGGRYDILVQGIERTRLSLELPSARGYRCFRTEGIASPDAAALADAQPELIALQRCVAGLGHLAESRDQALVEILHSTGDPLELADLLTAILVPQGDDQQRLLESLDLRLRLRAVIDAVLEAMINLSRPASHSPAQN